MENCVMVVAAHPDDAELGMGGTIAEMISRGTRVVICDLTDGEPTPHGSPEIRARESARASEILGVRERINLGLKNRELFDTVEARKKLAGALREVRPGLVFLPFMQDAHPDHPQASQLALAARFYAKFVKTDMPFEPHYPRKLIYYYSIHMRLKLAPSFVFDISSTFQKKLDAVRAYESQFISHKTNAAVLNLLSTENAYWGVQVGCEYGEPFYLAEHTRINSVAALLQV